MKTRVKIRGIYSTAITKIALEQGYAISEPSQKICIRLGVEPNADRCDLLVHNAEDLQGVEVSGSPENICRFFSTLKERLIDVAMIEFESIEATEGMSRARIEFPGAAKSELDAIRETVAPTLSGHHRFRIIDAGALEKSEADLGEHPEKGEDLAKKLFLETILLPLEKSGVVRLEHVRPSGKRMRPREGMLVSSDINQVVFKRTFSGNGRYDGLDLPIEPGDFCLTEMREGEWSVKHSYYTREKRLIGEYCNINTPVEFYPFGARYLDLEIDVVRKAGEPPQIIDQEKLALLFKQGVISRGLEAKAFEVAEEIARSL